MKITDYNRNGIIQEISLKIYTSSSTIWIILGAALENPVWNLLTFWNLHKVDQDVVVMYTLVKIFFWFLFF